MVRVVIAAIVVVLAGCATMKPEDFSSAEPKLVLEEYFSGTTRAWGLFEDRFGDVRRQFVVDIHGEWDGTTLTLDERFTYADGEVGRRVWRITKLADNRYEGRADDVIGTATGIASGNALNWRYTMDLRSGDRTWKVDFNDWMFLQADGVTLNRARVTKWGIRVGDVTLVFVKPTESAPAQALTDHLVGAPAVRFPVGY